MKRRGIGDARKEREEEYRSVAGGGRARVGGTAAASRSPCGGVNDKDMSRSPSTRSSSHPLVTLGADDFGYILAACV